MSILLNEKLNLEKENEGLDNKISDLREILERIAQED